MSATFGGLRNPGRLFGLHFFASANVTKLLEVARAEDTSARTLAAAFRLAAR